MKLALTHADLPNETKGGVAHGVHYLANTLAGRGHDVTLFTFSPAFDECRYTVQTLSHPPGFPSVLHSLAFALALARVDFSEFDLVHCHGDGWKITTDRPLIRTFHGSAQEEARSATSLKRKIMQSVLARTEKIEARRANLCVGISETTRQSLPEVTEIIPHGVSLTRFAPGEKSVTPTLLFVGTAQGRKRGQWLADLFTREIRPAVPGATLRAISDQPLEGEGIVNLGRVSSEALALEYKSAWVFCLPSTYEGQGIPYLEAMASGTVAVGSPNPGATEVLDDGKAGPLIPDDSLAQTLIRLLQNPTERAEWEQKGRIRATLYDGETIAQRYEALYRGLV